MASSHPLSPFTVVLFLFTVAATTRAQVPADKTFYFVNQGEFGGRSIEYGANYREIRNEVYTFYTFPFRLCFYNTTPDAFILAMRAGVPSDESLMRWVWDANRNHPVRENATLTFGRDGNFILADVDGRVVWQTNTANKGVTGIKVLPNGNLVLHNKNEKAIWQSFDHPTDTLLVGQSVRINGRNKLLSRTSDFDGSDGPYSIVIEEKGFIMYLNSSGQLLPYGGWGGGRGYYGSSMTFNAVPEISNSTAYVLVLEFNTPPARRRLLQSLAIQGSDSINLNIVNCNATLSFLRLGTDGSLRAYTYYPTVYYMKWEETFAFFSSYFFRECALPWKCGTYGLCTAGMCVACPSPKGLLGWSESCAPPIVGAAACKSNRTIDYYRLVGVVHFTSPWLDGGAASGPMKVEDCREKCNKDCKCLGFFYDKSSAFCLLAPVLGTLMKEDNTDGYIKYFK